MFNNTCETTEEKDANGDTIYTTTAEQAFRCYNIDSGSEYDMPPDLYRQTLTLVDDNGVMRLQHGKTTDTATQEAISNSSDGSEYYGSINQHVDSILNLFNPTDAALTAWEFDQLTKPNYLGLGDWVYLNEAIVQKKDYDICIQNESGNVIPDYSKCIEPVYPNVVHSHYIEDKFLWFDSEKIWTNGRLTIDSANILSKITPTRTDALGQSDIKHNMNSQRLNGFEDSNQDHSGEFHGYFSEERDEIQFRKNYWDLVIDTGMALDSSKKSGLQKR